MTAPHEPTGNRFDVQPDPRAWPECPECGAAWVLRRSLLFSVVAAKVTSAWVWQRDCKHRKAEPVIKEATA